MSKEDPEELEILLHLQQEESESEDFESDPEDYTNLLPQFKN